MIRPLALPLAALALLLLPAAGRSQFVDEYFSAIPASPPPGTYAPDVQAAIEEGYRQLALVSSPSDDAHLDPAKEAFIRALDLDGRAIHALNGRGMYELAKDEQWLVILESLKKILNRDHIDLVIVKCVQCGGGG